VELNWVRLTRNNIGILVDYVALLYNSAVVDNNTDISAPEAGAATGMSNSTHAYNGYGLTA